MLGYFTVLGNLATLILMITAARAGRIGARSAGGIVVVMMVVGLGYHGLLAGIWQPIGLAWWADQGLHTAVPILVVLWWVANAPKTGLVGRDAFRWLVSPMGYTGYALIRGQYSGFYPYPFLDLSALSLVQMLANVAGLAVAFTLLGLVLIGIARVIR